MTAPEKQTDPKQQTDKEKALRLAAARLLLGDDLALRLVEDQWNAVNELSDPYQERGHSARFSISAASLGAEVLNVLSSALAPHMEDLHERKVAAIGKIPDEERAAWFAGRAPEPALYAAEKAAPFAGDARHILREIIEDEAPLGELRLGHPKITVICKKRPNGTAWISVGNATEGPHFQCNYYGSIDTGPVHVSDFAVRPPAWVIERLGLRRG